LYAERSNLLVRDNQIKGNGATSAGAMKALSSQVLLVDNQIADNGTDEDNYCGVALELCTGAVTGNAFLHNVGVGGGADALHARACSLTIEDN
ncbi:hypothetical protein, partial [Salmonella sp. SAL4359]|uniref:hypothetical protein n=1 Tax=Salmonella sp. SAL4359 TaxID=3159880 RepID=UPI00397B0FFA